MKATGIPITVRCMIVIADKSSKPRINKIAAQTGTNPTIGLADIMLEHICMITVHKIRILCAGANTFSGGILFITCRYILLTIRGLKK